ncbi:hypothetical protein KDAU_61910 [Dictyobacter aurantiacus]|uniref:Uncharacterized protein n=1 Tax=Dictyobacter aurantiacus TaxID=1936993 RepID=A0A401ZPV3_9CHLR|nr:hypothetical protein KDAU_61910 [Dictyobacter aurantiacus]
MLYPVPGRRTVLVVVRLAYRAVACPMGHYREEYPRQLLALVANRADSKSDMSVPRTVMACWSASVPGFH